MLNALIDVLSTAAGFLVVLSFWIALQTFLRHRSGCGHDRDMLDFMLNGCGGCANKATCSRKKGLTEHHESL